MAFWGNSRKEKPGLNTLSELDIQEKLYGKLRPPHLVSQSQRAAQVNSKSSEIPFRKEVAAKENAPAFRAPHPRKTEDLFPSSSAHEEGVILPSSRVESSKISEPSGDALKKFQAFSREENKVVSNVQSGQQRLGAQRPSFSKEVSSKKRADYGEMLKKVGIAFLGFALAGVMAVFRFTQRFWTRKNATWAASLLCLALAFWGIHSLNAKREKFMTMPAKKTVAVSSSPVEPKRELVSTQSRRDERTSQALESAQSQTQVPGERDSLAGTSAANTSSAGVSSSDKKGLYVVQVATYAVQEDAEKLTEKIKGLGLRSFVKSFQRNSSGRVYHSVYIGRFSQTAQAEKALRTFKRSQISQPFQDAFVRSLAV